MKLAEPGNEVENAVTTLPAVAEPGKKSAMVEVDVIMALAEITEIDSQTRRVTVTGPRGNSVDLIVPDHIERFDELKVGDKVNAPMHSHLPYHFKLSMAK